MAIRKHGKGRWQVRVRPFLDLTLPTREAASSQWAVGRVRSSPRLCPRYDAGRSRTMWRRPCGEGTDRRPQELRFLKAALPAAQARGQEIDVAILEIEPIRVQPREGVALEHDDLLELASWLPERVQRIVPFCGTVGLRFTEAVTLTDDRVDLEQGTIFDSRVAKTAGNVEAGGSTSGQ
jgi:hypothetical protein